MPLDLTGYPSIDKPWSKYYREDAANFELPKMSVYENVWQNNKDKLHDIALVYFGCKINYKTLFKQTEKCAAALKRLYIKSGACISVCASLMPEIVYLILAASKLGITVNIVNPLFSNNQKTERINEVNSDLLFVMDKMYPFVKDIVSSVSCTKLIVIPADNSLPVPVRMVQALKAKEKIENIKQEVIYWRSFINSCNGNALVKAEPYKPHRPLIMVYSSGTTGEAKGIVLTNDGINATSTLYGVSNFLFERQQKFFSIVPPWFSTGVVVCLLMPLCHGVTCVLEPLFNTDNFINGILKYKPQHTIVSASLWNDFIISSVTKNCNLSHFVFPCTGGEMLAEKDEKRINKFFKAHDCKANIQKGWGMCELGSSAVTTDYKNNKYNSVGIPLPSIEIAAFSQETQKELKYNQRGEIRVKTPSAMLEYYKKPLDTKLFFYVDDKGNKWGCTGDIGYIDNDGFVFILGRANDYIIDKNKNKIYLFDIKKAVMLCEYVEQCEVTAAICKENGETITVAHIILKKPQPKSTEIIIKEIDALCKSCLRGQEIPYAYKLRSGFPIKQSGKRDMQALSEEKNDFLRFSDNMILKIKI